VWIEPNQHKLIGRHLAALRRQAKLNQTELAKLLRKPQSFVSAIENGQRRVDLLEFLVIVRTLGGDPRSTSAKIFNAIEKLSPAGKRRKPRP